MRTWTRRSPEPHCGACGLELSAGDLVQLIAVPGTKRAKVRCWDCAEGPIPAEVPESAPVLPPRVTHQESPPARRKGITAVADVVKDWKVRAAGEREPGEDDE